jgi:Beta-lactamase
MRRPIAVTVAKLRDGDGAGVQRLGWPRGLGAAPLVGVIVSLMGCDGSEPKTTSSEPADTQAARSQAALSKLVAGDDVPGCAAAVAERGVMVWQGARGLADLDAKTPIGPKPKFHIASISKQSDMVSLTSKTRTAGRRPAPWPRSGGIPSAGFIISFNQGCLGRCG